VGQYPNGWNAQVDFMALDFAKQQAWMVEVTSAPRLLGKISTFQAEYLPRIRVQLLQHSVISQLTAEKWAIGFWVFVPRPTIVAQNNLMVAHGVQLYNATALEDIWPISDLHAARYR
jgi:hypothetical protein